MTLSETKREALRYLKNIEFPKNYEGAYRRSDEPGNPLCRLDTVILIREGKCSDIYDLTQMMFWSLQSLWTYNNDNRLEPTEVWNDPSKLKEIQSNWENARDELIKILKEDV